MAYDNDRLSSIFDRTSGLCHLCGGGLRFANYGLHGRAGAWEVDHSNPRANGGTDRLNNLLPAHTSCNRSKRDGSTRSFRAGYGLSGMPTRKRAATRSRKDDVGDILGGIAIGALALVGVAIVGEIISGSSNGGTP